MVASLLALALVSYAVALYHAPRLTGTSKVTLRYPHAHWLRAEIFEKKLRNYM
jgi:hypothetical protein